MIWPENPISVPAGNERIISVGLRSSSVDSTVNPKKVPIGWGDGETELGLRNG